MSSLDRRPDGCRFNSSAAADAGDPGEEQVHVQAPAPRQVLGQQPAEHQPDRPAAAGDRAEDAERLAAFLRVAERGGQQPQRRGSQERAECALARARRHQHAEAGRGPADGGGDGEADQPAEERYLAPDQVARPPAEQQQAAECQRVGGHHPLPVHGREPQRSLRGRQRDVDDRGIEHHHQLGDADDAEDHPPAGVGLRRRGRPARRPAVARADVAHLSHLSGGYVSTSPSYTAVKRRRNLQSYSSGRRP